LIRPSAGHPAPPRRPGSVTLAVLALVIGLLAWASPGVAQDLSDVPTPEDLELGRDASPEPASPLHIEQPAEGADVQTPFTVSGRAPAGAHLELWLDDELQRVFKADSSGQFTTAVDREVGSDTEVWIHQVTADGSRMQSASVNVNVSGEAESRDRSFADQPRPVQDESPAATDAATEEESTPDDLTVFSDDVDPGSLTSAPVPPPVAEVGKKRTTAPQSQGDQAASEDLDEPEEAASVEQQGTYVYRKPPPSRFVRGSLEGAAGVGTGLVGAIAGGLTGVAVGVAIGDEFAGILFGSLGAAGGYLVGVPIGVFWVGSAMDGNGAVWATIVGELVGLLAAGSFVAAYSQVAPFDASLPSLAMLGLPSLGAVLGYELTSDRSRREANENRGVQAVRPVVTPTADGRGAALGFGFRF
jgi:hypothetical protein